MFEETYTAVTRNLVGALGAILLATTCLVAATGPGVVDHSAAVGSIVSAQIAATQSTQLVA